jgi:hypothetical protein
MKKTVILILVILSLTGCDQVFNLNYRYEFKNTSTYSIYVVSDNQPSWSYFTVHPGNSVTVFIPESVIRIKYARMYDDAPYIGPFTYYTARGSTTITL